MRLIIGLIFITSCLGQIRVNVGGPQYTDTEGQTWAADNGCTSGSEYTYTSTITGTSNPTLYQTGRTSTSSLNCTYNLVTNNYYVVTMKFAEYNRTYTNPKTPRLMNIIINGVQYYTAVNIFQMCGFASACDLTPAFIPVNDNGQISVTITQQQGQPMLSAISVMPVGELGLDASQISYLYPGTGAVLETVQNRLQQYVNIVDFGAVGDWNGTTGTDNCTALTHAFAFASAITIPPGHFRSSCTITITHPVQIQGAGGGVNTCMAATSCLVFDSGHSGITLQLGTRSSSISNLWIHSLDTGANSDHGIEIGDSRITISDNVIDKFGGDGIYCAASDPCDNQYINHNYLLNNYAAGWHCSTTADCNVSWIGNNTAVGNGTYGFYQQSGATNSFINDDTANNGTASFDIAGNSHYFENPYCEGGAIFNLRATQSKVESPNGGGCTFKNQGGPSNVIVEVHDYFDVLLGIGPFIGSSGMPSSPTYYGFRSGSVGTSQLDLHDDTNNHPIFHYSPSATPRQLIFDSAVGFGAPILQQGNTPFTLWKQDNAGSGTVNASLNLDGTDSTAVETSYGAITTKITDNTHAAQTGTIQIQAAIAGTLTNVISSDTVGGSIVNNLKDNGLAGSGTRCIHTDNSGNLTIAAVDCPTTLTAGGDLTGTYPNPALATVGSAGSCGDATHTCALTFDTKGRETARSSVLIAPTGFTGTQVVTTCTVPATPSGCSNTTNTYVNGILQ